MSSVLITAFEPYDVWTANASWLAIIELTRSLAQLKSVTTRLYPVHYGGLRERISADFQRPYDVVLHLGQLPGASSLQFEAIALNLASERNDLESWPLEPEGPVAYRSQLPLAAMVQRIREHQIPASISYHGGTHVCNAALYWSHFLAEQRGYRTQAGLVHVPLETRQVVGQGRSLPSLPAALVAQALQVVVQQISDA